MRPREKPKAPALRDVGPQRSDTLTVAACIILLVGVCAAVLAAVILHFLSFGW